ncbi:Histone-lysine N-methyltransferase ASHR1 [Bienertia sinuspersici]
MPDWTLHRVECQALSKLEKEKLKYLTPTIRLMVKLYLKRKLQNEKVISATVTDNYDLVEALVSHMSEIDEKQLVLYAQMANLVSVILQWPGLKVKEVAENFSKLACNAHSICDSELRPLGFNKLYRDCWKHHDSTKGSKRTVPIQLLMSSLLETGKAVPFCEVKGCTATGWVEGLNLRTITETCLPFQILMELNKWKDALDYCRMTIPVYEKVYPGCHPMLGLQYYTCGKLEWLLGETQNCVRSLSKALDILRVTHGANTAFTKELAVKLEEARAEASFKLNPLDED